ncbi:MAG: MAPEG family protein [Arenicella sp.]|nr:MAPEG family protein [Arenicella sp.]
MAYVALVTLLILIQYIFFVIQAGKARGKDNVVAPATTGDEMYERKSRVQINTLEQLIITLPAIMICAHYFRPDVAAILGWVFIIGRFVYSYSYTKDPKTRGLGFTIGFLANVILIGCGLYGIIASMI